MKEYIPREDALNFETKITAAPTEIQAISQGMALYAEHIKAIPAADVVEVVRCINCREGWAFFDASMPGGPYVLCGKPYAAPWETHKFDYFCADGKRKEDEKDAVD